MNVIELFLFISVLVVGIALLGWAHFFGIEHKTFYENDAVRRIAHDLSAIQREIHNFVIYRYSKWPLLPHRWCKSDYSDMKREILQDCKKYSGRGIWYAEASYSLRIDDVNNTIHYVVGKNDFDFRCKIT